MIPVDDFTRPGYCPRSPSMTLHVSDTALGLVPRRCDAQDATYALQPGQLSDIVESDSGVHVILRTG